MPEFDPQLCTYLNVDAFTQGYLECLEFTDCNENHPELENAKGFAEATIQRAREDCADFQQANADKLARYYEVTGRPESHAGHDFWLTRNGHGAGFWDRGTDPVLRELTDAAHAYGSVDVYAGDDSYIYTS